MGKRIYRYPHFVIFEQRTHLLVHGVLVRKSWQTAHVQTAIFLRGPFEVLCRVLSLPSVEDVWVAFVVLEASCWS